MGLERNSQMKTFIRVIITVFLFGIISSVTDLSSSLKKLLQLKADTIVICFILLSLQLTVTGYRWHLILKIMSANLALEACIKLYWIGMFFSQLLPTSIGGDVVRALLIDKNKIPAKKTLASIVLERFIGLGALLLVAIFYLIPLISELHISVYAVYVAISFLILMILFFRVKFNNSTFVQIKTFIIAMFMEIIYGLKMLLKNPNSFCQILALSVASHGLVILAAYLLISDLNGPISIVQVVGTMACALLVSALPLSISGWGLREGAMLLLLTRAGVSDTAAVASSVALGVIILLFSLGGGILYLKK